ncbi:hypothetical protein [Blastococcus goldschmidtiae]|uniref:Copper(I)-binding protein n=1 Tax=Blastococcus goldschmidtiae TaxID=3075546 RepID=A0ABU2K5P7_9ACTN|nr:hypothetical protein [Blastococcus sp. DSM 46792]MDT0275461.1 hypothetical protein [Blastococcus sp. DSM 46792]
MIALLVTGCGGEAPDVDDRGALDTGAAVSRDLGVLQAQLAYPHDGVYDVGEDAALSLVVANTGDTDDDLLDVRGPDFADALLTVDGVPGVIRIPADDTVHIGAEGFPTVLLRDVRTSLRSPESIPVTLVFAEAGDLTVAAVVAAEDQEDPAFGATDPPG